MPELSEAEMQRILLPELNAIPDCVAWRSNNGVARIGGRYVRFGRVGQGDLTGILKIRGQGVRLEIENKTAKGKQAPEQAEFEEEITRYGGIYILARDIDETLAKVRALTLPN